MLHRNRTDAFERIDDFGGILCRTVVGNDDFVGQAGLRQRGFEHQFQRVRAVVGGDDQRGSDVAVAFVEFDVFVIRTLRVGGAI